MSTKIFHRNLFSARRFSGKVFASSQGRARRRVRNRRIAAVSKPVSQLLFCNGSVGLQKTHANGWDESSCRDKMHAHGGPRTVPHRLGAPASAATPQRVSSPRSTDRRQPICTQPDFVSQVRRRSFLIRSKSGDSPGSAALYQKGAGKVPSMAQGHVLVRDRVRAV